MATFAKASFNAASYATFRPTYPPQLYKKVLSYHRGPSSLLLDLGCGHGLISREFAPFFTRVLGTDPSPSMVEQAKSSTPSSLLNISFRQASAEDLSFVEDGTLDMVVAGQAAHWFDYKKVWPELARKMRKGATLAFWGYKDNYFVDYPKATSIMDEYCYGEKTMGPYWEQPGRQILRDLYRDIVPPEDQWEDITRTEYEPRMMGKGSGIGELLMYRRMKLGEIEGYTRTFSSFHAWAAAHPEEKARKDGGKGDILDEMFDKMLEAEPEWREKGDNWRDFEVETEWGSVILMARKI
ncbi:S-adenosyl-L-methionine-dependent methyltransferase [Venustampulla echinocandica]|uniref:S-adenosyl-L-methionine-dependent methyltransferase n=1 Tax=Venustampulla echinocandica TaxID=2656787 RepID=A0A370TTL5_9HELO|nr:S-adenosyl-L-methionine-dependent methyltransferase [Venustampulla echinocandica]RDL38876.1 S-adenosyl-L-methionine-dependent methyltransferase [Venustampulla echinocandica]